MAEKKIKVGRGKYVTEKKSKTKKKDVKNGRGKQKANWKPLEGNSVASFAGLLFQVTSADKILLLQNLQMDVSSRWEEHEVIGKKPRAEFLGSANRELRFTTIFDANMGFPPHEMLKKLNKFCEKGKVGPFILGAHKIGKQWRISNMSDRFDLIYQGGRLLRVSVDVTLSEYV